ncbi:unnamed protein product [Rotaria sp. Silwood2]|nr:unnamed protein product [Rotaria sp. Silwood2]CAF3308306.1 unnamed protein product [Rotaria sp. Silwood2]CAF4272424.1 unnamed protein product [Rotaria sp. Silwood2]
MSYVVTGATGQVGSAVINYFLNQSLPVRAVIRSENKAEFFRSRHFEVAIADFIDSKALTKAFQGAKVVFAMNPPALTDPDLPAAAVKVSNALASAIKAAKMERVVVLSSIGAEKSSKTGNILTAHTLEQVLKGTAPQTVMGLGSMFQNLDRKLPHIATNDIGRVIAEYMTKLNNEADKLVIIELEGPEDYSPNDVAKIVSDALGKTVAAVAMTEEMIRGLFNKLGFPKTTVDNYIEMLQGFDNDIIRWTTNETVIRIKGKLTFADILNKN